MEAENSGEQLPSQFMMNDIFPLRLIPFGEQSHKAIFLNSNATLTPLYVSEICDMNLSSMPTNAISSRLNEIVTRLAIITIEFLNKLSGIYQKHQVGL